MPDISSNLGLNLPKGADTFDYDVFLRQNFQKIDDQLKPVATETFTATEGQSVFTLSNSYTPGKGELNVKVDGVPQILGSGYTETSATSITLSEGLIAGQVVEVRIGGIIPESDARFSSIESSLADNANYVLKATDFNIKTSNADNHDNIISALNQLKLNGGGTLLLPFGTIKTSPIDFTGYNNIVIKGVGRSYPQTINTTIKIVGTNPAGSVGLKFADTTNPYPDNFNYSTLIAYCKVEGIFLECDNKCDVGINGNRGLELTDVTVRRAKVDGIILEDYTYPVYLKQVESSYNGRHGFYARGKMSTVYTVRDCEFTGNTGYGMYIEGGANPIFTNVLVQANKTGGVKINKISGYTGSYFLDSLTFINLYTEANGTLLNTDPLYEGNYGVYITGYDKTNASTGKPSSIKFIGGKINVPAGAKPLKIDAVWGCKFDTEINGNIDIASVGVYGLEFATVASSAMLPQGTLGTALTSYRKVSGVEGVVYNGGLFPSRGRVVVFNFYLSTISAGQTVSMDTLLNDSGFTGSKGYSMIGDGSILGIQLVKKSKDYTAGSVTVKPQWKPSDQMITNPNQDFSGFTPLSIAFNTTHRVGQMFTPDTYKFTGGQVLGLTVTASADYAMTNSTYDGFVAQLFVEI